ncbi:PMT_2 domain-containing protein [Gammaproteobacteria bacterium]
MLLRFPSSADSSSPVIENETRLVRGLVLFLGMITLYRAIALVVADLPLFLDEAYYFDWSRTLEFGYYSKPPLIAWAIAATTSLCGDGELCVRTPALLAHPFTAFGLFLVGRRLYGAGAGRIAALLYITLPMVSLSSWIMSTDALLLLFWTYGLWFLVRALEDDHWGDWLGLGVCIGVGLLAKYTMVALPLSLMLYLVFSPGHRYQLRRPKFYAALAVAMIIFSPNVIWNLFHGLVSWRHTADNAALDHPLFHPAKLGEFLGGQFMVFGPVLTVGLLVALAERGKNMVMGPSNTVEWRRRLLLTLGLPLFVVMCGEALAARANANWAAPSYLSFTLLVAAWFAAAVPWRSTLDGLSGTGKISQWRSRWLIVALAFNVLVMAVGYHYDVLSRALGVAPVRHLDPYARLRGWRELAAQVQDLLVRHPGSGVLGDDRAVLAELGYYLRPRPVVLVVWNPAGTVSDHYRLNADIRQRPDGEYLFIARGTDFKSVATAFGAAEDLGVIRVPTHRDSALECHVYWVKGFQGYRLNPASH